MRRVAVLVFAGGALVLAVLSASAATSYVAPLGTHGAARWTLSTSLYVNLRAMTPGTWKQQLWAGTCARPTARIAVLPGLVVTSTRTLAKTTKMGNVLGTDLGVVLRLLHGSTVVCGAFVAPLAASPSSSPASPSPSGEPSATLAPTSSASEISAPPSPTYTYVPPSPASAAPTPTYTYHYP